ncbi:MAG: hypothetical protein HRU38_05545 [Saccharospirillaceae bacterium]|nr:hypothetical protein [Pseudomonadales bacterium]NRB78121.1 hypothetical protein [Saccharospirillaceae bacterium]
MNIKAFIIISIMSLSCFNLVLAKDKVIEPNLSETNNVEAENNDVDTENQVSKKNNIDRISKNVRFAVNISTLDMPFPLSAGFSVIYQNNPKWLLEFNYLRNLFAYNLLDVDAKEIGQQHFSLKAHYFVKEKYYATIGIGKRFTTARMDDKFFNYNNYSIKSTLSKFNSDYLTVGVGSVFKLNENIQLNLDWAAFNYAFSQSTSQSAVGFADGEDNQQIVAGFEKTLEGYVSNTFLRLSVMGQY